MKRIIYLSLLLVIPFLVNADHRRERLNGKWISPYHGKEIKVKVDRHDVRIKNLTRRGWSTFRPGRKGKFIDIRGNEIRINNFHQLTYRSNCGTERIRFVKKGHNHHNHVCNRSCGIGHGFFYYSNGNGGHDNDRYGGYLDYGSYDRYDRYNDHNGYSSNNRRNDSWSNRSEKRATNRINGRYYVREINEYVVIEDTRNGLRAKRGNQDWVNYNQNNYRKNEYLDQKGNRYQVRSDGSIFWKNKSGSTTLNLNKS